MRLTTTAHKVQAAPLADNDNVPCNRTLRAKQEEHRLGKVRSGLFDANFAYGRRNAFPDLIQLRCGGPRRTDDAEMLADLLVPFIVEAATIHKLKGGGAREPFHEARTFLSQWLPAWTNEHHDDLVRLVDTAVAKRAAAVARHDPADGRHVQWLPTMDELVAALKPRRAELQQLPEVKGWGCIDPAGPEERREADRLRKKAERAAKGATPREKSITAQKPWEAVGISERTWYRHRRAGEMEAPIDGRKTSGPCIAEQYGVDETLPATALTEVLPLTTTAIAGRDLFPSLVMVVDRAA